MGYRLVKLQAWVRAEAGLEKDLRMLEFALVNLTRMPEDFMIQVGVGFGGKYRLQSSEYHSM